MKKLILIAGLFLGNLAFAQAPEKMSYQAVIRNAMGQLIANQNVAVKASIYRNTGLGTVLYSERLTGTTNVNGLLNLEIGGGTVLSGTFASLDWSVGNFYLRTETDPTGGTNYTIAGTSQLLSVPYAMYAKSTGSGTSQWTSNGNNITNSNTGNVGIGNSNPAEKLEVSGKTKTTNLQITNGAGAGKLLASDANGNANWTQMMRSDVLSIGPFSFVSANNKHQISTLKAFFPDIAMEGSLAASVILPKGAIISQIKVHFLDNNYDKDYTFRLTRVPQGVNVFPETIATATSSGGFTVFQYRALDIPSQITIDNSNYFYYISMSGDFTQTYDGICGVQITYSYPINN